MNKTAIYEEKLTYTPGKRQALFFKRELNDKITEIEFGSTIGLKSNERIILEGNTINTSSVIASYSKSNIKSDEFEKVYNWFKNNFMPIVSPQTQLQNLTINMIEQSESCKRI